MKFVSLKNIATLDFGVLHPGKPTYLNLDIELVFYSSRFPSYRE
jgi:hypothetical protein